jgi:citrate lyase beta subunit
MQPVRSVLSVPGAAQRFLDKAAASPADVVMVDWEDGVAAQDKPAARALSAALLATLDGRPVWIRINAATTEAFTADVAAVRQWPHELARVPLVLPMATLQGVREATERFAGHPLIAMIETAQGVEEAADIAASTAVRGLMFGEFDYLATMSLTGAARMSDTSWTKARLVNAAAAAGIWAVAGPVADIKDTDALSTAAEAEAAVGFAGKLCIHPTQIEAVNTAFLPSPQELDWSRDLLAEIAAGHHHDGAFRYRGRMVDAPVIDRARAVLQLAGEPV